MKMKKLLAAALAATMMLSSMVSAFVASAAETVGTITVGTAEVELGVETADVDVTINFTKEGGVTAPHDLFTLTAPEGFTITDASVTYEGTAQEGSKGVYIDPDGRELAQGKILLEAPVDEMAPTVTKIVVTVTYAIADTVVAGTHAITVDSEIADITETDLVLEEKDGAIVVKEVHECTPAEAVKENEVPATCYAEGSYDSVVYCSDEGCKKELSRTPVTVEKIAHTPAEAVVENNVDATCYAEGSYDSVVYCAVPECKAEISRTPVTVDKTEHTPAEAVVENNVDATCYAEGSYDSVVYCAVAECKHEISRTPVTVEKIAHTPAAPVEENRVEAQPGVAGSYDSVVYCSVPECKAEISRTPVEIPALPTGPVVDDKIGVSGSILISETLGISYVLTGLDAYNDFEIVVTKNAYSTTDYNITTSEVSVTKAQSTYYKGSYYSMVYGFALTDLCLDVTAQVKCYDANGELVAVSVINETTIKDLAVALYSAKTTPATTKTLLTDLLNMGSEAQTYFAGRYVNSDLAKVAAEDYPNYGFDQTHASATVPALTLADGQTLNNGATMTGVVSILQSPAIAYVLKPTSSSANIRAEISFYDAYTKTTKTTPVAASEMTLYKGSYYYNFSTLPLYSSNAVITANLYNGDTLIGTHTYTVEQYISENLDGALGGFMSTIAKFGASARTYFKIG